MQTDKHWKDIDFEKAKRVFQPLTEKQVSSQRKASGLQGQEPQGQTHTEYAYSDYYVERMRTRYENILAEKDARLSDLRSDLTERDAEVFCTN